MKFPDYVPATVREYLTMHLDAHDPDSWVAARDKARAQLERHERQLRTAPPLAEKAAHELRRTVAADRAQLDGLERNVKCLERLGLDSDMRKALATMLVAA